MNPLSKQKPIIAIDGDGVLLNYHVAYREMWQRAFGILPSLNDENAYWVSDRWDIKQLTGNELDYFRSFFNEEFWGSMPAIPGALKACEELVEAGFELVCVSAIKPQFEFARLQNLRNLKFPIHRVIATSNDLKDISPKAEALIELCPVAFVDDFLPYFRGLPSNIHNALILREQNGSPNVGTDLKFTHSQHLDLASFSKWWTISNRTIKNK